MARRCGWRLRCAGKGKSFLISMGRILMSPATPRVSRFQQGWDLDSMPARATTNYVRTAFSLCFSTEPGPLATCGLLR